MADNVLTGGCMCGSLRYEARGEPLRIGLCHCATCRKNTGAPYGAWADYPAGAVTILSGETGYFQSSPEARRHFCKSCGSPVFIEWPDTGGIDLFLGTFDEAERLTPTYELWTIRRLPWLPETPDLKSYERNRTE